MLPKKKDKIKKILMDDNDLLSQRKKSETLTTGKHYVAKRVSVISRPIKMLEPFITQGGQSC